MQSQESIYYAVKVAHETIHEPHEGIVPALVEQLKKRSLEMTPPLVEDPPEHLARSSMVDVLIEIHNIHGNMHILMEELRAQNLAIHKTLKNEWLNKPKLIMNKPKPV